MGALIAQHEIENPPKEGDEITYKIRRKPKKDLDE